MKRRLRKKLHRGEYQEMGFVLAAAYEERADIDALYDFTDKVIDKLDEMGMDASGYFDFADFDILVNIGTPDNDAEALRDAVVNFVKALPGVTKVEAGELIDAWHNSL